MPQHQGQVLLLACSLLFLCTYETKKNKALFLIFLLSYVLLFFTGIISLPLCFLLTPLVSNSWLKPMLFLFHNRADLWHLKAEALLFFIISAWLCYYLKCDEMRRATVTDEERPAGGFWRWGTPLDARWGLYLSANLAVGSLLTRVKKISGCEGRRPSNRWDHVRHRRKVKWFDQQGTDPVEYNSSKKSTLYEIYNNKSIKQAEELNLYLLPTSQDLRLSPVSRNAAEWEAK